MTASSILAIVIIIAIALFALSQGSKLKTDLVKAGQKFSFFSNKKPIAPEVTQTQTVTKNGVQQKQITAVITTEAGGTRVVTGSQGLIDRLKQNIQDFNNQNAQTGVAKS